jgi:hypothetical protein
MTRNEASKLIGNQPKWALTAMAKALQIHSWNNTEHEWNRLRALKALGYKVRITLPEAVK